MILSQRPDDNDNEDGFIRWPFMTTHAWSEISQGPWTLDVVLEPLLEAKAEQTHSGVIKEWKLVLHGTKTAPYAKQPVDLSGSHEKLELVFRAHKSGVVMA